MARRKPTPDTPAQEAAEEPGQERLRKPDSAYLAGLLKESKEFYEHEDRLLQQFRELVYRKKRSNIPEKFRHVPFDVALSDLEDEISRVAALVTSKDPILQVKALGREPSDAAIANATQRQHHTMAALKYASRVAQGVDAWRALVRSVIQDGAGVSKLVVRRDLWQERYALEPEDFDDDDGYPKKRGSKSAYAKYNAAVDDAKAQAGPPVAWVPVDLATWYPVWSDLRVTEHLEVTERPTHEVLAEYRLGFKPTRSKGMKLVPQDQLAVVGPQLTTNNKHQVPNKLKVLEHWDDTYCTIGIEHGGDVVIADQYEHHYGRAPYFFTAGRNFQRGSKIGMSAVDAQSPYVELLNYLHTIEVNVAVAGASPPIFHTMPEGAEENMGESGIEQATGAPKDDVEKWHLGTLYHGRPGEKFEPMILPQISGDLKEIIQMTREKQQSVMMPKAAAALGGDIEGAGFALAQILAEIRAEKSDILMNLCNTLEEITRFYWHLVRTCIGEAVYAEGADPQDPTGKAVAQIDLGPDDLKDPVSICWDIDWDQDSAKLVRVRLVSERLTNRTLNLDKAIEMLGDNPDEVRLGQLADWVRDQPEYKQMALTGLFQLVGRGDQVGQAANALAGGPPAPGGMGMTGAASVPFPMGPVNPAAGVGPDMGAAAVAPGAQAPGRLIPPGPVRGEPIVPGPHVTAGAMR